MADVVNGGFGIPEHGTLHVPHLVSQCKFGGHLVALRILQVGIFGGALHVFADIERTVAGMLVPPSDEGFIVGSGVSYLPVNLWYTVVYPSVVNPKQHVCIEVVIVLQSVGVAAHGRTLLVAVDAEGRYAELHPRFDA